MKRARPDVAGVGEAGASDRARGLRIALVTSRFNADVTARLLDGARACLEQHGGDPADWTIVHVPGSWELQLVAHKLAGSGRHDAVVALGALIRGETPHFEVLAHQVARGLARASLDTGVPVIFGVLTTDNLAQALARAGESPDNKGWEAALAAIELVRVCGEL